MCAFLIALAVPTTAQGPQERLLDNERAAVRALFMYLWSSGHIQPMGGACTCGLFLAASMRTSSALCLQERLRGSEWAAVAVAAAGVMVLGASAQVGSPQPGFAHCYTFHHLYEPSSVPVEF